MSSSEPVEFAWSNSALRGHHLVEFVPLSIEQSAANPTVVAACAARANV